MPKPLVFVVSLALLLIPARFAHAQIFESVGTRAQGMGGAFVAVADDATATWWNPAGLATGAYFSSVLEWGVIDDPGSPAVASPARRDQSNGFAVALPSLGLSYYHLRVGEVLPLAGATAGADSGRQDQEAAGVALRAVSYSRFGASIGQSIGRHVVIASTLALLYGGIGASNEVASADSIDHASDLDVDTQTIGDMDLGAMVRLGILKLGANVKHVTEPHFGSGTVEVPLERQARAGLALVTQVAKNPLTLAGDVDLTKTPTVNGEAQHIAGGAELFMGKKRLGLRGGVSANLVDEKRTSASAGASVALKTGFYVDGAWTFGDDKTRSGWGVSMRATF
jgi:hypothetical protein